MSYENSPVSLGGSREFWECAHKVLPVTLFLLHYLSWSFVTTPQGISDPASSPSLLCWVHSFICISAEPYGLSVTAPTGTVGSFLLFCPEISALLDIILPFCLPGK